MKMHGELVDRHFLLEVLQKVVHLVGCRYANGVGNIDFVTVKLAEIGHYFGHVFRSDLVSVKAKCTTDRAT